MEELKTDNPERYETLMRYRREVEAAGVLDWDKQCETSHRRRRCL